MGAEQLWSDGMNFKILLLSLVFIGIVVTVIYLYIGFIKTIFEIRQKKELCTKVVDAKIVAYKEKYSKGNISYIPIYEYEYNGEKYIYEAKYNAHINNNMENKMTGILINPDDPKMVNEVFGTDLYSPVMAVLLGGFVVGVLYIVGFFIKYMLFGL